MTTQIAPQVTGRVTATACAEVASVGRQLKMGNDKLGRKR